MQVLKAGRQQNGWSTETTCTGTGNGGGGCRAELLVEEPDLYKTYKHCRDETDVFVTFRCGACGVETDLKDGLCPNGVMVLLPDKDKHVSSQRTVVVRAGESSKCGRCGDPFTAVGSSQRSGSGSDICRLCAVSDTVHDLHARIRTLEGQSTK